MQIILALIALAMVACLGPDPKSDSESVSESESGPIPLLDPFALMPVEAGADPLAHERPSEVKCPSAAWGPEGGGFEIQTGVCNYAAFDQPLSVQIEAGDAFNIVIWHDTLDYPEPATAHVAVWIGGEVLWEAEVAIPASSDSFEVNVPIDHTPAPDDRLGLHLHNHGFNSWRFVAVDLHPH